MDMEVDEHYEGNAGVGIEVTVSTVLKVQYSTSSILGSGSIGTYVFKGKLDGRKKNVAVKEYSDILLDWLDNDVDSLNTAEGHNVVRYFCTLTNNENKAKSDFRYLAMELCDATLKDWAEKTKKGEIVQEIKDLDILSQCISGLMFIHEMGLAHGNLRPNNILLLKETENNFVVKISDFGLKRKNEQEDDSYISNSLRYLGWWSPEYWNIAKLVESENKLKAGIQSDIFSMGCIFYYVVTKGQHPFGDINQPLELQTNIESGQSSFLSCEKYKSRGVLNLIKLMIDSSPERRPPLAIVQSHPLFWETYKVFRFFGHINTYQAIENEPIIKNIVQQFITLAQEKNVLGNEGWIMLANNHFHHKFDVHHKKFGKYNEGITELVRAIRNFGVEGHKNDAKTPIKFRDMPDPQYINDWLNMFPKLLPCAWVSFKSQHAMKFTELNKFYGQWKEKGKWKTISQEECEIKCKLSPLCKELV